MGHFETPRKATNNINAHRARTIVRQVLEFGTRRQAALDDRRPRRLYVNGADGASNMSKRWTKVPEGTWERVNATRRAARDRRKFLDTLKNGGRKVDDYVEMTHDSTNFTINATRTGDFHVSYG